MGENIKKPSKFSFNLGDKTQSDLWPQGAKIFYFSLWFSSSGRVKNQSRTSLGIKKNYASNGRIIKHTWYNSRQLMGLSAADNYSACNPR